MLPAVLAQEEIDFAYSGWVVLHKVLCVECGATLKGVTRFSQSAAGVCFVHTASYVVNNDGSMREPFCRGINDDEGMHGPFCRGVQLSFACVLVLCSPV